VSKRRSIPELAMSVHGQTRLRQQGIVVVSLEDSLAHDPLRLQPHYHDFFQVILFEGPGTMMHDFRDFYVKKPTLIFLSPGQIHTIRPKPKLQARLLSFTQSFFDDATPPPSKLYEMPFFFPEETKPWLQIPTDELDGVRATFAELQREFDAAESGAEEILRASLRILFIRLSRLYLKMRPPEEPSRAATLVRQFHVAVESHLAENRTLTAYARDLGVTANHLSDVVKEKMGHAPGDIIRQRRLLEAKRLLSHSDLSVSEIGYELGFDDPSYFGRFFRRYAGETPVEFRDKIREKYH
jgi:AraC family transcriptional regulator, transcriptional activator of pobA